MEVQGDVKQVSLPTDGAAIAYEFVTSNERGSLPKAKNNIPV